MTKLHGMILSLCLIGVAVPAHAETSMEYAKLGQKIWPAFECAVAAEKSGYREAQQRLFNVGYENGKIFVKALRENKVSEKVGRSTVALHTLLALQGPSADFMLGRVWETVAHAYYDKVQRECSACIGDAEMMKRDAQARYRKMNCEFFN